MEYRIRWGEHAGRKKCGVVKADGVIETKEGLHYSSIRSWVRSGPFHCPQGNEGCRDSQNTSPSRIASMVEVRQRESFMLVLNGCRPLGYVIHVCAREILAILYLLTQCSARLASQHTFSCTRSKLKFRGQAAQEYRRKKRAAEEPFQILSSTAAAATTNCSNSANLQDESVHSGSSFVGATTSDPAHRLSDPAGILLANDFLQAGAGEGLDGLGQDLSRDPASSHLVRNSGSRAGAAETVEHDVARV